jgi:hypothetical protein
MAQGVPESIRDWLACLVFFLGVVLLMKKIFIKDIAMPQPMLVRADTRYATHEELGHLRVDMDDFIKRVDHHMREMEIEIKRGIEVAAEKADDRSSKIHHRIDGLSNQVHELVGIINEWRRQEARG